MITLDIKISNKAKDIIQKYASGLFKDSALAFYGVNVAPVKELINVELPAIEVTGSSTDYIFLLEDNTYLHLEFQTGYNIDDLVRFASYDIRLYGRDKRKVTTVIVYSAKIKKVEKSLDVGSLNFSPENVMMIDYDGDSIYIDLEKKILSGQDLTDVDIMNLIFLPLMKHKKPGKELAVKSVELAKEIPDRAKRDLCIASIFAFSNKYLNEDELKNLMEVIKMTDLATMLMEDAANNKAIEMVKKLIKLDVPIDKIAQASDLTTNEVEKIKESLKKE